MPAPALPEADRAAFAAEPSGYSFFQMILLLDRYFRDRPPVGAVENAGDEPVRFRALPSLGFPAADIATLAWHETPADETHAAAQRLLAEVTFLGLYGPSSPLAPNYTELVLGGDRNNDTLKDFLDLFNHRLVALLYRCWKKYRYYVTFESGAEDEVSSSIFALLGRQGHVGADRSRALDWVRLLPYAGVLGMNCRSPSIIASVISGYFGVPARIEEAVERLVTIPEAQQNRLGERRSTLESDWVLGDTLRDVSGKFRVWLGPLDWRIFSSFLPGGANHDALFALVRYLARNALDFDIWAVPAEKEAPGLTLGGEKGLPLGWATWLGSDDSELHGVPIAPHASAA